MKLVLWALVAALAALSLALLFGAIQITGTVPIWMVFVALAASFGFALSRGPVDNRETPAPEQIALDKFRDKFRDEQ